MSTEFKISMQVLEESEQNIEDRRDNNPKGSEKTLLRDCKEDRITVKPTR